MIEILRILNDSEKIIGSKKIADEMQNRGFDLGERAVRYHMKILDEKGFTERVGYSGRKITSLGRAELDKGLVYDQVDFIFSKFEEMIYETNFDFKKKDGNVIVNTSSFKLEEGVMDIIKKVTSAGLVVSPYITSKTENTDEGEVVKMKTICGTTIDGMLLNNGIPSLPLYGGLLEVEDYMPKQFSQLISYKKTSITPLEAFISDKMTSVLDLVETGTGTIPANFRVIPANAKEKALNILDKLKSAGIGGVIKIGKESEEVLGIPIDEGMLGIAVVGGVAPLCAAQESGYDVDIKLGEGIAKYTDLKPVTKAKTILKKEKGRSDRKVQFLLSKTWNLFQSVDFDIETHKGNLITNISFIKKSDLDEGLEIMSKVYQSSTSHISPYYKIIEDVGGDDEVGIATICSLSLDGILIKNGIMSSPKYGGLLEMTKNPKFIELIAYSGSSLDPHEIYIFKNMTSVSKNENGYKIYLSSVKEIPVVAREDTKELLSKIEDVGVPIYKIGKPREIVYNTKIDSYNFAIVSGSGLNPIAAIKESGIDVKVKAVESLGELSEMESL
jgi:repressor of nif and glnA expression